MDKFLFLTDWLLIDVIYLYAFYNLFKYNKGFYRCRVSVFFLLGTLLSTVCFIAADYYGYRRGLIRLSYYFTTVSLETIYWYLAKFVNYDNLSFRLILSLILFSSYAIIIKKFAINKTITIYIAVILLFLSSATLLRSSVSDGIIFIGILNYYKKRSLRSVIFLCICFAIGMVFHKSSFMVVVVFVLAYFMKYKSIRTIVVLLLPIEILLVRAVVGYIFSNYFPETGYNTFVISESRIAIVKMVCNTLFYALFLTTVLLKGKTLINKGDKFYNGIYQYVFCAFILWTVFLFSGASRFVADRLLMHAMIPITLLLSYLYIVGKESVRRIYNRYLIAFFMLTQLSIFIVWLFQHDALSKNEYIGLS